jgi:hypothetical protein
MSYVKDYYNVPDDVGRQVTYKGRVGVIYETGGNYVNVNFDDTKPGIISYIHPKDPDLTFGEIVVIRKITRSQRRYQDYLRSDSGYSFKEYLKICDYPYDMKST